MAQIVSIHSFRGGTGKSNTAANLSALLAMEGKRVGVIDTDIQSPGIHVLFGLREDDIPHALNDYLWGKCSIEQAAMDVTPRLKADLKGRIFLTPSSIKAGEIARVLREGYDVGLLNDGFHELINKLKLDVLVIDTHPGLNEETLLSIAISDVLVIVMRPDQQDYQGTGVTVAVARKLDVPRLKLIVNKVPACFDPEEVKAQVEQTYGCEVAAVLPHSDEMMILASAGIFVLRYPDHPITASLKQALAKLLP
jgi:MinD-like ATPase involved in chromosome partitioning or flagellar assembly